MIKKGQKLSFSFGRNYLGDGMIVEGVGVVQDDGDDDQAALNNVGVSVAARLSVETGVELVVEDRTSTLGRSD